MVIRSIADKIDESAEEGSRTLLGGFGIYPRHDIRARSIQTPYVHVDVRGYVNLEGRPPRWEMP